MKITENIEVCDCVHTHKNIKKRAISDDNTLYALADLFKVFGDPTRIRILYALSAQELCVCDIASVLDIEVGKRGWINYMTDNYLWETSWHRIHTSVIEKIDIGYVDNCINKLTIVTMNTVYTLTII